MKKIFFLFVTVIILFTASSRVYAQGLPPPLTTCLPAQAPQLNPFIAPFVTPFLHYCASEGQCVFRPQWGGRTCAVPQPPPPPPPTPTPTPSPTSSPTPRTNASCNFSNLTEGQIITGPTDIIVTGQRPNPSYSLTLIINGVSADIPRSIILDSVQNDTLTFAFNPTIYTSYFSRNNGGFELKCRIRVESGAAPILAENSISVTYRSPTQFTISGSLGECTSPTTNAITVTFTNPPAGTSFYDVYRDARIAQDLALPIENYTDRSAPSLTGGNPFRYYRVVAKNASKTEIATAMPNPLGMYSRDCRPSVPLPTSGQATSTPARDLTTSTSSDCTNLWETYCPGVGCTFVPPVFGSCPAAPTPVSTLDFDDRYNISGSVFIDRNGNGIKDTSEVNYTGGADSIVITFLDKGGISTRRSTDVSGNYFFTVSAGNYNASYTPPNGHTLSAGTINPQRGIVIPPNQTFNFGITPISTNPIPSFQPVIATAPPITPPAPVPTYIPAPTPGVSPNTNVPIGVGQTTPLPPPTPPKTVKSITIDNKNVDLGNPYVSLRLPVDENQSQFFKIPVTISYSDGSTSYLVLAFDYQATYSYPTPLVVTPPPSTVPPIPPTNTPPIATLDGPTSGSTNKSYEFSATVSDTTQNLSKGQIWVIKADGTLPGSCPSGITAGSSCLITESSLAGRLQSFFGSWTATEPGSYLIFVQAFDSKGDKCSTAFENLGSDWSDCGPDDLIVFSVL